MNLLLAVREGSVSLLSAEYSASRGGFNERAPTASAARAPAFSGSPTTKKRYCACAVALAATSVIAGCVASKTNGGMAQSQETALVDAPESLQAKLDARRAEFERNAPAERVAVYN